MSDRLNDLSLAEYVKASTMIGFCGGVSLAIFTFLYGMFEWEIKELILNVLLALFASTGAFTSRVWWGIPCTGIRGKRGRKIGKLRTNDAAVGCAVRTLTARAGVTLNPPHTPHPARVDTGKSPHRPARHSASARQRSMVAS